VSTPKTPNTPGWVEVPQVAAVADAASGYFTGGDRACSRAWEHGPIRVISSFMPESRTWLVTVSHYNRCPRDPLTVEMVRRVFGMEQAQEVARTERQCALALREDGRIIGDLPS
jgi:hypothetical protein